MAPLSGQKNMIKFNPLGTVLIIMPWNYPFWQVLNNAYQFQDIVEIMNSFFAGFSSSSTCACCGQYYAAEACFKRVWLRWTY